MSGSMPDFSKLSPLGRLLGGGLRTAPRAYAPPQRPGLPAVLVAPAVPARQTPAEPSTRRAEHETPLGRPASVTALRGKILAAVARCDGGVSVTDLILTLWKEDPGTWCLRGHPEHPDSSRVQAKLATLTGEGYLWRPTTGRVAITTAGRRRLGRAR